MLSSAILLGGASICASFLMTPNRIKSDMKISNTFIMAEAEMPTSFDPLFADYSNNLHASQMVHRTILEVGDDNTLTSGVLKDFGYDPNRQEIYFEAGSGVTFSDGTALDAKDIELTIKRMALKRPKFPVLRHIVGIQEWAKLDRALEHPLPGVRVENNKVYIKLSHPAENPLYRFALPLFGIVKSECVDKSSNKLSANCATSGIYRIEQTLNNEIVFSKVKDETVAAPSEVKIRYIPRAVTQRDLEELKDGNVVVLAQEYALQPTSASLSKMGFRRFEQPNSRFSIFLLNPKSEIFREEGCRRIFAREVRSHIKTSSDVVQKESSIFTRVLPGFMSSQELDAASGAIENESKWKTLLKGKTVRWMPSPNNNNQVFETAFVEAAHALGMRVEKLTGTSNKDRFDQFVNGEYDILLGGSGFWAFDPVGDVQMLFTPGLHKPLAFLASDSKVQEHLNGLEFEKDPSSRMKELNIYLHKSSLFNVFSHSKRVYLVKGDGVSSSIPVAITPPAPWQVFNVAQKK